MFDTGRAQLSVQVNGTNLMIGADVLDFLHIIEHAHATKPSIALRFMDNKQAAGSWGLFQDGAKVSITIGDSQSNPDTFAFRQFGLDGIRPMAAGDLIPLNGVADLMPWFTSVVTKAQKGNASDVVAQLAHQFGIPLVDVESTIDKMTWLPDNRTVAQFCRNLVDHAWMGQGSSPFKVLTSQGGQWMLRIKDIMKQGQAVKTLISNGLPGAGQDGSHPIFDFRVKSHGGALNSFANYGLKLVTNNLGGGVEKLLNIDINALAGFVGINADLSSAIGVARTIYAAASHGNTHDNYHQAYHANIKSRASFSTELSILLTANSGLRILDDVMVQVANAAGQMDQAYSGMYKVSGKTRSVSEGSYRERLTVVSQGTNIST